jgi:hypothetical protein
MTMDEPRCSRRLLFRQPSVVRDECHYPDELLAYENSFSAKGAGTYASGPSLEHCVESHYAYRRFSKVIFPVEFVFIRRTKSLVNLWPLSAIASKVGNYTPNELTP